MSILDWFDDVADYFYDCIDQFFRRVDDLLDHIEDFLDWIEPFPEHPYAHEVCKGCDHLRWQHSTRWLFRWTLGCSSCPRDRRCHKFIPQAKHFKHPAKEL